MPYLLVLLLAGCATGKLDVSEPLFSPNSYMNQPGFTGYDPVTGQAMFNTASESLMPPAGATPMTGKYPMPAAIPTSDAEQAASTLGSPAFLPGYDAAYGEELDRQDAKNLEALEAQ